MRVTLHQLTVFEQVAHHGSVTRAAHALHMTQPAVSNILKQLEDYYQCPLTEVIGRKLSLTPFGEALLEGCRELHTTMNNIQAEIELLKGGLAGTLRVATVSTAKYFMPHLLGAFKRENPGIHINMTVCNRREIIQRLQENLDDFVIMSHPPGTLPVDCADFYDDELVVAASPRHKLSQSKQLSLNALQDDAWIIREPGSGTRYATEVIFKKRHFTPRVEMEISNNEAIKQAIVADMGISVISKQSIKLELENQLLQLVPVKGFPVRHIWSKTRANICRRLQKSFMNMSKNINRALVSGTLINRLKHLY